MITYELNIEAYLGEMENKLNTYVFYIISIIFQP